MMGEMGKWAIFSVSMNFKEIGKVYISNWCFTANWESFRLTRKNLVPETDPSIVIRKSPA